MPIRGLTDRKDTQFPKIGDIRKGAAKPDDRHIGKDLTHFRAVFDESEAAAAARFKEVYGDEPREINIMLPFAEIDRNFEAWQEAYTAGALQHRCDGETCVIWRDQAGELHHEPKPCPGGCRPVGRLKVIIPELRRLAYVVVHTTSRWDIVEITANLEALSRLTGNGINGIPLVLKRRPRLISTPMGDGKRARREKWLLSIEADPAWVDAQIGHMRMLAMPRGGATPELPAAASLLTGEILDEEDDGDYGEDEDEREPAQEIQNEAPQQPPEPDETPESAVSPELQAAMAYTTKQGKRLGEMGPDELNRLLDWCDAHPDVSQEPRKHILVLLEYLKPFVREPGPQEERLP